MEFNSGFKGLMLLKSFEETETAFNVEKS